MKSLFQKIDGGFHFRIPFMIDITYTNIDGSKKLNIR